MQLDARAISDGDDLTADLCIIGAGPAGLTLASEFIGNDIDVLLLESGGPARSDTAQDLNEGTLVGDPYAGLRATRQRQIGGTATIWNTPVASSIGAKYVPLAPSDLEARSGDANSGWPIQWSTLEPWYHRAQSVAGLGPFAYDAGSWSDLPRPPLDFGSDVSGSHTYQFGPALPFTKIYPEAIRRSPNVRLCHSATLCRLVTGAPGNRVIEAQMRTREDRRFTVRARTFVLAGGAIENARMLLVSGLGGEQVGRGFMEHPRDYALTLTPSSPKVYERLAFYDVHPGPSGTVVCGRLALAPTALSRLDSPNASATLLPIVAPPPRATGLLGKGLARLRDVISPPPAGGYGWSRRPDPARAFQGFRVLMNLEQRPHSYNRVELGSATDPYGLPRAALHWRWSREDQSALDRLRSLVAASLEASGVGRVTIDASRAVDPNAHHHSGTTRMALNRVHGVTDPEARVHGLENLYIAGSSLFPTAGFANPTLTILALTLRLADHLKGAGHPGS